MVKLQTLKGFRDFLPSDTRKRHYVINTFKGVFESFGFEPLETPALEYEEVLMGKYGEEGDKLMYRFTDNGGRAVALRYDQTVPLSRVVAQYQNDLPSLFKRYQIQPVWRAENTQKGRFREFLQCDCDIVGSSSALSDAEVIMTAVKALETLGFENYKVLLNDRAVFEGIPISAITAIDKLKKIGEDGVIQELIQRNICSSEKEAQRLLSKIQGSSPTQRLEEIFSYLKNFGLSAERFEYTPTLARGLDYYTSTIIEIEIEDYTAGSVCGGGRYDNLIGTFAGRDIPAVGFAFGFDRVLDAMEQFNLFPDLTKVSTTRILVTIFNKELLAEALKLTSDIRSKGINAEIYDNPDDKLEKQIKYADKKGIMYAAILGPEEIKNNTVTIKNLRMHDQQTVAKDDLLKVI